MGIPKWHPWNGTRCFVCQNWHWIRSHAAILFLSDVGCNPTHVIKYGRATRSTKQELYGSNLVLRLSHDEVFKWKYFPCYWPFVRGIHRSPVAVTRNFGVFFYFYAWTNGWANNRCGGDLRCHRARYDVTVMNSFYCDEMNIEYVIIKFWYCSTHWGQFP